MSPYRNRRMVVLKIKPKSREYYQPFMVSQCYNVSFLARINPSVREIASGNTLWSKFDSVQEFKQLFIGISMDQQGKAFVSS